MTATRSPDRGGGVTATRRASLAQDLAAWLPPLLVAAERVAASVASGIHGRRRPGPGETFWQYRHAQPGDPAGAIDWRRSARSDGLFLRETEWAAAQGVWLWPDPSPSMTWRSRPGLPPKRDRALLLSLALAALLLRGGERVGLLGGDRPPASGPASLPALAEAMTRQADGGPALPRPTRLARHGEVVLVSDFLLPPDALAATLSEMRGHGVGGHLLQVLDPAEERFPYQGRIRFGGLEGEADMLVRRAEDVRDAYADRLGRHRDAIAAIAAQAGWSFAVHHTDQPPQLALLALHARLGQPRGEARR